MSTRKYTNLEEGQQDSPSCCQILGRCLCLLPALIFLISPLAIGLALIYFSLIHSTLDCESASRNWLLAFGLAIVCGWFFKLFAKCHEIRNPKKPRHGLSLVLNLVWVCFFLLIIAEIILLLWCCAVLCCAVAVSGVTLHFSYFPNIFSLVHSLSPDTSGAFLINRREQCHETIRQIVIIVYCIGTAVFVIQSFASCWVYCSHSRWCLREPIPITTPTTPTTAATTAHGNDNTQNV
eukprot:c3948_g1_i3.p1 GENE.c3948_g1_i3~~c3948_g1_i3.p1  ORF type:complete len:249 (+),score=38.61 c3948_g1_i3:42-749(+)